MVKPFLAFAGVCAASALLAWAGGYNFDHRGANVGLALYFTLVIATCAGFITNVVTKK